MHKLSKPGQSLFTELNDSLEVFRSRFYSEADFFQNEFLTKLNALIEREIIDKDEAARLKQACADRVRNIFSLYPEEG